MQVISLFCLFASTAGATEVVWLQPPSATDSERVAKQAGATGPALEPLDLRAAATAWTETDQAAYDTLDATLGDVRSYETKLDGELVIMRDLMGPIEAITLVRDEVDRNKLYAALAYQGFAVNRFFDMRLAEDEQAAAYRIEIDGVMVERPWADAVALDPKREVTPYDIAEAPQRVAYGRVSEVVGGALPAQITPVGMPDGAVLKVDGRGTRTGPAGNFKLMPGRHLAHIELDGRVIARWDFRVGPGMAKEVGPELDQATWAAFLTGIGEDAEVPAALAPAIEALGGEVWIARPGDKEPEVFALRPDGLSRVKLDKPPSPDADGSPLSLVAGLQGGWFYSGDFYLQNPVPEKHENDTVNATSVNLLAAGDLDIRGFHVSAGVQTWLTMGEDHAANTGGSSTRIRPYPHVGAGIQYAQLTFGYLFPYHAAGGVRLAIPVVGPLEILGTGLYGLPGKLPYRDDSGFYKSGDVRSLNLGVGVRL